MTTKLKLKLSSYIRDELSFDKQKTVICAATILLAFITCLVEALTRTPLPSLLLYMAFLAVLTFRCPSFLIKYWLVLFLITSNIAGVFAVETNRIHLHELGLDSSYAGSCSWIILAHLTFLTALILVDGKEELRRSSKGVNPCLTNKVIVALLAAIILASIAFVLAATHPFFSTTGIDRFEYKTLGIAQKIASRIVVLFVYLIPLPAMAIRGRNYRMATLFIVLASATAFLTGNKFGFFMQIAYIFMLSMYLTMTSVFDQRKMTRAVIAIGCSLVLLVGLVFLHNRIAYGYTMERNLGYFSQRIAQQGQLWWRTYQLENKPNTPSHISELDGELSSWFNNDVDPSSATYGIYKIMLYDVADKELFYRKVADGSQYAYSTQASLYYYFKMPGVLLFAVASAFAYGILVNRAISSFNDNRICLSIVFVRLLSLAQGVLTQSVFNELFSFKVLTYIVLVVLLTRFDEDACFTFVTTKIKSIGHR